MQQRMAEHARGRTINLEIQMLACAMGYTCKALWPRVKKLQENHDVGRALELAEEKAILEAAAKNQSRLIYRFFLHPCVDRNESDEARTLPWSPAVLTQHVSWCVTKLGPLQPNWYVFPLSNRLALKDPLRPVSSLKTA